jgi:hypothetical protein
MVFASLENAFSLEQLKDKNLIHNNRPKKYFGVKNTNHKIFNIIIIHNFLFGYLK